MKFLYQETSIKTKNVPLLARIFSLVTLLVLSQFKAEASPYYLVTSAPWGNPQDVTCMNNVFGVGGWTQGNFTTPAATVFAPTTPFVMMEGSDGNSGLPGYITANQTAIENWVAAGGRLFINAAPNYGTNQNWGFSNTQLMYPSYAPSVSTTVPTDQIFIGPYTPTATAFTGNYFAHGYISGTGLTHTLYDNAYSPNVRPVLSYKLWGAGIVFFGACTEPNWWNPNPQGINVWQNIFMWVWNFPLQSLSTTIPSVNYCSGATPTINYTSTGLTLNPGNVFTAELSDAAGSFATPTAIGSVTSTNPTGTIPCTIPLSQVTGTGYRIRTTSSNVAFIGSDNGANITINTTVTPGISITASPGPAICLNQLTTFTATTTNGGPSPTYQWYLNGNPVGTNSPTYTNSTLATGDLIYCKLTSNATCAAPPTATSNVINMDVTPPVPPTITIFTSNTDSGCVNMTQTFNSVITLGGPSPIYQWYVNGNPVGTNSASYSTSTLVTGDVVTCDLTSNNPCVSTPNATSNALTMTILPVTAPDITIEATPGTDVCPGGDVVFTATTSNGGPGSSLQWVLDGGLVGTNSATYQNNSLVGGDSVKCIFINPYLCSFPHVVNSNTLHITTMPESPYLSGTPGNTITRNYGLVYAKNFIHDAECKLMLMMEPQGSDPVNGRVEAKVTIDNTVQSYNGQPYLQRHFDIEPVNNATTATSIITMYAYQDEFDAYNAVAVPMGLPPMPVDWVYDGNIRITQFHGVGTQPGNYPGGVEYINPAVYWDTAKHWWQLSFQANGFSGFYIHTGSFPLQLSTVKGSDFSIAAWPNPVTDKVTIQVTGYRGNNSAISLVDLTGKFIMRVPMENDKAIADLSGLASGMYFIKYTDDKRSETVNLVKQ
jgi:hypothetical protein